MPIDSITVHLTDGIKQSDYAPNKVYDLTAILTNPQQGEVDHAVDMIVNAGERFLGRKPALPPTSSASQASPSEGAEQPGEPQRRTRRTKAEMEAARSAETEAGAAAAEPEPSPAAAETAATDEWDVGATDAPIITDQELSRTCSETAGRTKKPLEVKEVLKSFKPATDMYNVEKGGRKFHVSDIPQSQRADFLAKLKALT